jgi:hypothetical protein
MRAERRSNALREEGAFRKEKRARTGEAKNRTILLKYTNSNGQSAVFSSSLFFKPTALYIYKSYAVCACNENTMRRAYRSRKCGPGSGFVFSVECRGGARARFCFFYVGISVFFWMAIELKNFSSFLMFF